MDAAGNPLCLLQVHAHPDDEASKGSGTNAKYHAEGVRTVLVCCTGGEAGDILNPAMERPEVRERLHEVRIDELRESVRVLGYDALHLLGYHDSGMPDTEVNHRPDNFANAPMDEAVERLVRIIRAERPQVIITYGDDREFYPHPDHLKVHDISGPAFDAAGDPERFPDAGEPWQPSKLYYTGWSLRRVKALHHAFLARGEESPYERWFEGGFPDRDDAFTTMIDVSDFLHKRREALLAHRTQVDPEGFWMRLPDDVVREVYPWEDFVLARSLVDATREPGEPETDLFAGLRAAVAAPAAEGRVSTFRLEVGKQAVGVVLGDDGSVGALDGDVPTADDAAAVLTVGAAELDAILDGTLDASVAFMRGRLKAAGDTGAVLGLLRVLGRPEGVAGLRAAAAPSAAGR